MRGRSLAVALTVLLSTLLAAPAALGDTKRVRDGNDAHGPLDIRSISHAHRKASDGTNRLVHTVRLQRAWPVRKLGKHAYLLLSFRLPGKPGSAERTVQIEYEKGRLVAWMFDTSVEPGKDLAPVRLKHKERTLRVSFPKILLRDGLHRYRWNAASVVERKSRMCRLVVPCVDWAPGSQNTYVRHVL